MCSISKLLPCLNYMFQRHCENNATQYETNMISDNDELYLCAFSYWHRHYKQSEAGVDFVSANEKIRAAKGMPKHT